MEWDDGNTVLDLTSALTPWLRSGHATSLVFDNITSSLVEGLPAALALAPSLTRLEIIDSDKVIDVLLTSQTRLSSVTQLKVRVNGNTTSNELRLVKLLSMDKVTGLDFCGHMAQNGRMAQDVSSILATLPRLPALQELSLKAYALRNVSTTLKGSSALHTLDLCVIKMGSPMTRIAFLDFMARCPVLDRVSIVSSCLIDASQASLGDALARCFRHATSLRHVTLHRYDLDAACAAVLATALAGRTHPVRIEVADYDTLTQDGFEQLAAAAGRSVGGVVELTYYDSCRYIDKDYDRFTTTTLADTYRVRVSATRTMLGTDYRLASLREAN
ncbi:hypothetical protein SDRG_16645 [Saprolegnia diclina VS20]|uniref:RNI-like protein n=1 Tax=Saprolegnia diclina (strain VS20) TaxID=1156394 RepID=T0R7N5_SAPDV|nr:hypothetical protein SDRG_16645 [Saprolegnia diclina VS20]EQC25487.1 hypothetical protein SDRG_16645 [Saprolegnia diclina VS20]|eukprot:XP_008621083.1 hypothetical protein SDRG_16645 [Saprolegnia diclina VS20]